jgi:hypothetical protein
MAIGFFSLGLIAEAARRKGIGPLTVGRIGMSLFTLVQLALLLRLPLPPALLWGLFGAVGTSSMMCYAYLSQTLPAHLAGRVNTAINLLAFTAAFLVQTGVGALVNGLGTNGQIWGLGLCLGAQALGLVWGMRRG